MNSNSVGENAYRIADKLFPICRSITGKGVLDTLNIISSEIGSEITIHSVPSGSMAFDWAVPKEWEIRDAYIEDENGNKIIDFKNNNLFVMGYSTPVNRWVELEELLQYIHTQPDQPDVVPYVTSYYKERYGFCMSEKQKQTLRPGKYHMFIDSSLFDGSLTYGELIVPGRTKKELFFSTYICHPSMANNECSGPALSVEIAKYVINRENNKYTYRFVWAPETIGSILYLDKNLDYLKKHMLAGFILTCVGDNNAYSLVQSRYGNTIADRTLDAILSKKGNYTRYPFLKRGSDERQYCSPGVDLPVVTFCRSKFHEYPEYHTSADDMNFISPEGFQESFNVIVEAIEKLEKSDFYTAVFCCEPQLGKRGLYSTISQKGTYGSGSAGNNRTMIDFLAYCDGTNSLEDISSIIGAEQEELVSISELLEKNGLITNE